jgi:serine/threonine protein kinase
MGILDVNKTLESTYRDSTCRSVASRVSNPGVVHCDLKPANVLLKSSHMDSRGFTAKVSDFGLSR